MELLFDYVDKSQLIVSFFPKRTFAERAVNLQVRLEAVSMANQYRDGVSRPCTSVTVKVMISAMVDGSNAASDSELKVPLGR